MKPNPSLKKLAALGGDINAYSDEGARKKDIFHEQGKAFLKALAADLGLESSEYSIRSNVAGVAVSGEVTLHADHLYVQLHESAVGPRGLQALYRSCDSRNDYSGHQNNTAALASLQDEAAYAAFVAKCEVLQATAARAAKAKPAHP